MKVKVEVARSFTLELTEPEFELLMGGIGKTSPLSREAAGMTREQALFMTQFYMDLAEAVE